MREEQIKQKLDKYYLIKQIIMAAVFSGMISMFLFMVLAKATGKDLFGVLAVAGYVLMIVSMLFAAVYPVGKYELSQYMAEEDVKDLLNYITNMNYGINKSYDSFMVIKRSVKNMVGRNSIYEDADSREHQLYNNAWRALGWYFKDYDIKNHNTGNAKKYAEALLRQIREDKFDTVELLTIRQERKREASAKIVKEKRVFSLDKIINWAMTVVLTLVVFYKLKEIFLPGVLSLPGRLNQVVYDTGADIISFVFAVLALSNRANDKK